jgi:hypothetical protein
MFETKCSNDNDSCGYSLNGLSQAIKNYIISNKISYFSCPKCKTDNPNTSSKSHKHFIFVEGKIYAFGFWGTNDTHWEFWGLGMIGTFVFR